MQGKLTIETEDFTKFKTACDFAEVIIEEVQKFGSKAKVQVKYRSVDQIYSVGRIQDSVVPPTKEVLIDKKVSEPITSPDPGKITKK